MKEKEQSQVAEDLIRETENFWDDPGRIMILLDLLFLWEDPDKPMVCS